MRAIVQTAAGVIELNWMWLPTWLGMNSSIKRDLEEKLKDSIEGMEITESNLDIMHTMVLDRLVESHPSVEGLRDYLDGLKFVNIDGPKKS